MKRTTVALEDDLLRRLKERAAREGTTLQALANALLRQGLSGGQHTSFKLHLAGWAAETRPGVDLLDRDALFDHLDGR